MPYHIDEENSELAFEVREGNKLVIKIKSNIFSDSLELYLIKVGDNTEPTDKNVFSSLRVLKEIENLHDTILKEINSVTSGFWELKQDSQGNEYIATKYNVLTEGGLTTYGLGEQKLGTIYDGLPIDNDTIYWEEVEGSRVLKAKGSGGGSTGLDETKLWNVLGTPGDQQIDYSHLRSAFSQFSNEFVTINTEQEITALKHFTAGLSIGSAKKKIYEKDGVLYIDSNVAITGALTMYATDGQSVSSIYDGLPIDNDTIYWETVEGSRVLKAKGSGGEAGSVQWGNISGKPTWIGDTKPTYNWSEIQGEKPFYTKEEIAKKYVTIDTEQEISGLKHFTHGFSVGKSKKKIYEEEGVVYIDADVAVTGGMTFYATAGRSVSTIMDAVAVDGITIKKENNVLKAIAGAGSSFDENAMWSALSGSSDNQINKSHLTTALDGYATQNWVIENYATKSELSAVSNKLSDFLEGSDTDNIINKWKELEAFLSGMAETDNLAEILETKADKKYVESTFVTLATKQTITGEKTFSSVLNTAAIKASGAITAPSLAASDWVTIAGIKLRKLEDGALMLEGNLALTGALTMYASNGQSFDTIYDGLPIDNDTIYWQEVDGSRVLKAREGSGSSFDKSAMWTALAGSTTEQINKSHLTTALTGYATESWVSGKNYAVKATTLAGYGITDGINAVSVTGTGNAITAASISGHTLTLTKGSTFSLSGHKHAWSDITSGKPTTLSGYGITDAYTKTDADSRYVNTSGDTMSGQLVADGGIYLGYGKAIQSSYTHLLKTGYEDGAGDFFEIGIGGDNGVKMYLRGINNGTLVWNGNTVWNAANSNRSDANWSCYTLNASRINSSEYVNCAKVGYNTSDSKDGLPWYGMGYGNHDVMTFSGYGGVNIRTAFGNNAQFASNGLSYFHSHVLIKGSNRLSFDDYGGGWYMQDVNWVRVYGDKNIYTGGAIQCDGYVYTGTGFRINYGTNSAFINVNWDGNKGDFVTFHTPGNNNQWFVMELWSNGNVYTNGNFLAEGGSTFYGSDIRYKSIMQQVNLSLSDIAKAPSFVYHWNREGMKCDRLNLGGSAQYTQSVLPWAVEDNSNFLMMDYATVAYTFSVHTARHLLTYESRTDKKIKKLENRVKYLEKQLKKLGYEEVRTLDDQSV